MERIVRLARYFRRARGDGEGDGSGVDDSATTTASSTVVVPSFPVAGFMERILQGTSSPGTSPIVEVMPGSSSSSSSPPPSTMWPRPSDTIWDALVSILLWDDVVSSFLAFLALNSLFWFLVILDCSSFNVFVLLAFSSFFLGCTGIQEGLAPRHEFAARGTERAVFYSRLERLKQIGRKILHSLEGLRSTQPGLFCILSCTASVGIWLFGNIISGALLVYIILMSILLVPLLLLKIPSLMPLHANQRESDSEIEEFLPAATETDIQVLTKAGEAGECSPTPTITPLDVANGATNEEQEFLNDVDLAGHKMPSHEDGSSDGLELSDLELSEKSSPPTSSSTPNQSDSEFEIIDQRELDHLHAPRDTTS